MSIEDINNAAAAQNALTARMNAFVDESDTAVAAKLAEMDQARNDLPGEMRRIVYLDPVNGDDANEGRNAVEPVATTTRAVQLGPQRGALTIYLMADTVVNGRVTVLSNLVYIRPAPNLGFRPKFELQIGDYQGGGAYTHEATFMIAGSDNRCHLAFDDVEVILPAEDADPAKDILNYGFLAVGGAGPMLGLSVDSCTLTIPATPQCAMFVKNIRVAEITVSATAVPAELSGKWVAGGFSSTDPTVRTDILTNLTSL